MLGLKAAPLKRCNETPVLIIGGLPAMELLTFIAYFVDR